MKYSLPAALAYLAVVSAAPVTVTSVKYVVATTRYTTLTINNAPSATEASVPTSSTETEITSTSLTSPTSSTTPTTSSTAPTTSSTTPATTSKTPITSTVPTTTSTVPTTTSTAPTTTSKSASSTSSTSSTTDTSLNTFEAAILAEHNKKRALHGVPNLTWNPTLAEYAANYAASSFSCDNVQLIHSHGPYGENLAAGYVGGASPVDAWYDEISQYDYSNPGYSEATGHFTQVVWKSTTEVGCAMVSCDNVWRQYTICEYSPAGNVVSSSTNYFELNVLPLV